MISVISSLAPAAREACSYTCQKGLSPGIFGVLRIWVIHGRMRCTETCGLVRFGEPFPVWILCYQPAAIRELTASGPA